MCTKLDTYVFFFINILCFIGYYFSFSPLPKIYYSVYATPFFFMLYDIVLLYNIQFETPLVQFCRSKLFVYTCRINKEINHGSQNVLGVLTWVGGY